MYFVEIAVIFFARLYCMISKWSVDKKYKKNKETKMLQKKNLKKIRQCVHFGENSLHDNNGVEFWYSFKTFYALVVFHFDQAGVTEKVQKLTRVQSPMV